MTTQGTFAEQNVFVPTLSGPYKIFARGKNSTAERFKFLEPYEPKKQNAVI